MKLMCALCKVHTCEQEQGTKQAPGYCAMASDDPEVQQILEISEESYKTPGESRNVALASARVEAEGYLRWPRVQEVMEFAWKLDLNHLGIASCIGLIEEAKILQRILEQNGFEVSSVCCKVGSISKIDIGLTAAETVCPDGTYDPMCNPIGQAKLLNYANTDLNILVGLCVGHDSLFIRNSKALVTVLVAKDRVTGHNPIAALYTNHSYYSRLGNLRKEGVK